MLPQHKCGQAVIIGRYDRPMERKDPSPTTPAQGPRLTMAEEQRLAFEDDQRRIKRGTQMRWPGFLFRN